MTTVWRTASYLRPHARWLLVAVLQVAALSALELLKPWPLQLVIDHVLTGSAPSWRVTQGLSPPDLLAVAVTSLVAIYALIGLVTVLNNHTTISIGQRMVDDLRSRLYAHVQRLSLSFHARAGVGDLLYRVTADTYSLQTLAINGLFPMVAALLLLGGMFVVMLRLDASLTLVALGVCPVLLLGIVWINRRMVHAATDMREKESAVYQVVQRNLSAIRIVQAFSREDDEHRRFVAGSRASLRSGLKLYTIQTAYGAVAGVIIACGTAAVLWVGAHHVWAGRLSVGEMVVFVSYLASLYGPINSVVQTYGLAQGARAGVERVFAILDEEPALIEGDGILPRPVRGRVEFRGVTFSYPNGGRVLRDVSLEVEPGECVAIVGATGAGKSTLVSLVPRFYDPDRGQVQIDGVDLRTLQTRDLRRQTAMVLQPPIVFPVSVHDNIAYGRPQATRSEVVAAARIAQADGFISRLPLGYDAVIGEQGATLSEGERQRLTIARAVLRDAPILILDEPTSSVDAGTEAMIMSALARLIAGRTTLLIAHRLSTMRLATRIVVIERGCIVEQGAMADLLRRGGAFHAMHQRQLAGDTSVGRGA